MPDKSCPRGVVSRPGQPSSIITLPPCGPVICCKSWTCSSATCFCRRMVDVGVTRHPTDAWLVQQLREATPFGSAPKYLVRDNDNKFGTRFAAVAARAGIEILKTPFHAPKANAFVERLLGSVRRECLDHLLFSGNAIYRLSSVLVWSISISTAPIKASSNAFLHRSVRLP
jgi:hypothetical protein